MSQENKQPASTPPEQLRALVEKQAAALAEMETRMQNILRTIPLGLLVINKLSRLELSNKLAQDLFGYEPREMKGQNLDFLFPDTHKLTVSATPFHLTAKKKGGETFPVEVYVNEFDSDLIFAHVQDITERIRLETLRQQLLTMVSHDLRSPLTTIRMQLGILAAGGYGELPKKAGDSITKIESNTDLMISLVNDLLDSEQLKTGEFQLDIQDATTHSIVDRAIEACRGAAEKGEISLEAVVTNDHLRADEDRIVRVLVNLIGNAIKFSPKGSRIVVSGGLEGTKVVFGVSDQGPGIPQELQAAVFERYRQLEQSKSTKKKGLGLGLYICKSIVEKHGGTIWVQSKVGVGSTFCFSLPI